MNDSEHLFFIKAKLNCENSFINRSFIYYFNEDREFNYYYNDYILSVKKYVNEFRF